MLTNILKKSIVFGIIVLLFGISTISSLSFNDYFLNDEGFYTSSIRSTDNKKYDTINKDIILNDTIPPVIIDNSQSIGYTGDEFGFDAIHI